MSQNTNTKKDVRLPFARGILINDTVLEVLAPTCATLHALHTILKKLYSSLYVTVPPRTT